MGRGITNDLKLFENRCYAACSMQGENLLSEIGEARMDDGKWERLARAVRGGDITFFLAMRSCRAVGMCSVSRCFSTFAWDDTGVFDDFFVEPVFRCQGGARLLAEAAQVWCREQGLAA